VVVSTEEVLAVAVSTAEVLAVVGSTGEAFAVAVSTGVPVSVGDVSPVAVSVAVAFVVAVLVGAITDSLMMSSSAASAFRDGGAGGIRTDITVTTITRTITMDTADIHMVTDIHTATMDTADTHTAMDTAGTVTTVAPVMDIAMEAERATDTAMAADQAIPGVCRVGDTPG
jgi:mevalonate kinase